jgi:hypothetical protein
MIRLISTGIVMLTIGLAVKSVSTSARSADAGLQLDPGFSVFGTIHPKLFDLPRPVGSQMPTHPNVRLASLESRVESYGAAKEGKAQADASRSTMHDASIHERFAASFGERTAEDEESVIFGAPAATPPARPTAPTSKTFSFQEDEVHADSMLPSAKEETTPPAGRQPTKSAIFLRRPALTVPKEPNRSGETPIDLSLQPDSNSRTAIYDIQAHAVYLPNGDKLEAHSGLGPYLDDPHSVGLKDRGSTPPNVYDLVLRNHLFHGIRAIRLIPVAEGRMFGRDGMLAHSYMLGPNGQSNRCVSFSNYRAFLGAFLRGEVDRLMVVKHLATAPGPSGGSAWRHVFNSS